MDTTNTFMSQFLIFICAIDCHKNFENWFGCELVFASQLLKQMMGFLTRVLTTIYLFSYACFTLSFFLSQGTKAIEGLALKLPRTNTKCLSTKAFKEMKKLRLLQLAGVQLVGDFKYLSKDLRWLCWHGFPLACIPTNLYQGSLVSIELENSNVNLLWKEAQVLIQFFAIHEYFFLFFMDVI